MGTYIIIAVLAVVVIFALRESIKHLKGKGGCCGGGSEPETEKKTLEGKKIAEKIIHIEGMHCENCKNSVERQINKIEGAVCKVNLRRKTATVEMDRMIDDEDLRIAVERLDFKVTGIESGEV